MSDPTNSTLSSSSSNTPSTPTQKTIESEETENPFTESPKEADNVTETDKPSAVALKLTQVLGEAHTLVNAAASQRVYEETSNYFPTVDGGSQQSVQSRLREFNINRLPYSINFSGEIFTPLIPPGMVAQPPTLLGPSHIIQQNPQNAQTIEAHTSSYSSSSSSSTLKPQSTVSHSSPSEEKPPQPLADSQQEIVEEKVVGEQPSSSSSSMSADPIEGIAPLTFERAVIQGNKEAVCRYLTEETLKISPLTKKKYPKPPYEHITELCSRIFKERVIEEKEAKENTKVVPFNVFQTLAYKAMKCSSVNKLRDYHEIFWEIIESLLAAIEKRNVKKPIKKKEKQDELLNILRLQLPIQVNGKKYTVLSAMFCSLQTDFYSPELKKIFEKLKEIGLEHEIQELISTVLRELFSDDGNLSTAGQKRTLLLATKIANKYLVKKKEDKSQKDKPFVQAVFTNRIQENLPIFRTLAKKNCHKTITTVLNSLFKDPAAIQEAIQEALCLDIRMGDPRTIYTSPLLTAMEKGHKETTNALLDLLPLDTVKYQIDQLKERRKKKIEALERRPARLASEPSKKNLDATDLELLEERNTPPVSEDFLRHLDNYLKERQKKENPKEHTEQSRFNYSHGEESEREKEKEREMPAPKVESKSSKTEVNSETDSTVISSSFNGSAVNQPTISNHWATSFTPTPKPPANNRGQDAAAPSPPVNLNNDLAESSGNNSSQNANTF